jgi:hypothetical protein
MQRKFYPLTSLLSVVTCAVLALTTVVQAQAQDKKADPNGTWTSSQPGRNGGAARVSTFKLKVEGDKLTGTVTSPGRQGAEPTAVKIENGKVKADEISFDVTREVNGNKMTRKYSGKISGDAIKGKVEFERNGETQSQDWAARSGTATTETK